MFFDLFIYFFRGGGLDHSGKYKTWFLFGQSAQEVSLRKVSMLGPPISKRLYVGKLDKKSGCYVNFGILMWAKLGCRSDSRGHVRSPGRQA